jgi:hypothetical protein
MGTFVLPQEALNGMITEDKLRREQKRLGNGRMELWKAIISYLRQLVQLKPNKTSLLAGCVTRGFVFYFNPGDKDRMERKVLQS